MLTVAELRRVAARSGARDITKVEIDVILTHLLQLFTEKGITEHVAFKGGTLLRKMHFGPRGRLSTDLDFTARSDLSQDDIMVMMLDALSEPYHGLSFTIADNDWYLTDDGCAANPVCAHEGNQTGVNIKLQISIREKPVLPIESVPQLHQEYFDSLGFKPAAVPSLVFEEAVAEKIRAASQRSKIRDLHDLSEISGREINRDLIRSLAVIKLWNSGGAGLNYDNFAKKIRGGGDYDIADLTNLLRKDQKPDLDGMMKRVVDGFRFLNDLTEIERILAADGTNQHRKKAEELIASLQK